MINVNRCIRCGTPIKETFIGECGYCKCVRAEKAHGRGEGMDAATPGEAARLAGTISYAEASLAEAAAGSAEAAVYKMQGCEFPKEFRSMLDAAYMAGKIIGIREERAKRKK